MTCLFCEDRFRRRCFDNQAGRPWSLPSIAGLARPNCFLYLCMRWKCETPILQRAFHRCRSISSRPRGRAGTRRRVGTTRSSGRSSCVAARRDSGHGRRHHTCREPLHGPHGTFGRTRHRPASRCPHDGRAPGATRQSRRFDFREAELG